MRIGTLDTNTAVLVIAEIGNNHEGSVARARELVEAAADSGADAVKFQTYRTEHFVAPSDRERYERLERFRISFEEFGELAQLARSVGLLFISTPLDLESARFLLTIADGLKVASADNDFTPLLETVAAGDRPLIVSTGLTGLEDIDRAVAYVDAHRPAGADSALLHCVSSYPAPDDEVSLRAIPVLEGRYPGWTIGYSDHTLGIEAAVLSVAAGARIVEKHFTLDKGLSEFRDHQLSADPPEFRQLVERIRAAERLAGRPEKVVQPSEAGSTVVLRRSVAAAGDLEAGRIVREEDVTWLRPGGGLRPGEEDAVVGRRLRRDVARGSQLHPDDVE